MTFVLAGSASAVVVGPAGNSTVLKAPVGAVVSPLGERPALLRPSDNQFFKPQPFFRPVGFNPFFRPVVFNPFFRPQPFFNPFFGADVDDFDGFGVRAGFGEAD